MPGSSARSPRRGGLAAAVAHDPLVKGQGRVHVVRTAARALACAGLRLEGCAAVGSDRRRRARRFSSHGLLTVGISGSLCTAALLTASDNRPRGGLPYSISKGLAPMEERRVVRIA